MDKHGINGLKVQFRTKEGTCKVNEEAQFQLGLNYLKKQQYETAERWFRYAATQGHYQASCSLSNTRDGYFRSTSQPINSLAIKILEKSITPFPIQPQIAELKAIVTYPLNTKYGLMRPLHEKE